MKRFYNDFWTIIDGRDEVLGWLLIAVATGGLLALGGVWLHLRSCVREERRKERRAVAKRLQAGLDARYRWRQRREDVEWLTARMERHREVVRWKNLRQAGAGR